MQSLMKPALAAAMVVALMMEAVAGAAAQGSSSERKAVKPPPAAPENDNQGNLSQRLNRSNGVIKPPKNVDPGMSAPVPNPHPHTTPVIPPPGSPGGDQNVQPK